MKQLITPAERMFAASEMEDPQTGTLLCPECEAANLPQRKFCARCGTSLWEKCFRCNEVCAAGENFCGSCGVNLDEAAAQQREMIDAALRQAADLQSEGQYEEAVAVLAPIGKLDHPRLTERAARARQLTRQLAADRQRGRTAAQEAAIRGQQFFDAGDYVAAARLVDRVPKALRGEELELLRSKIAERLQQIENLGNELREAVRKKRITDLPPLIEQLLALQPEHTYARAVAGQVQKRLVAAAEKKLAEHDYDAALHLVEQLGPHEASPRAEELRRRATELACLAWDLRTAPVIDATLTAVAERARQVAPDDARLAKLCAELGRRSRTAGTLEPALWARAPKETAIGPPIEWLTGFRRFALRETADGPQLRQNPGCFVVACGLALTGLNRASMNIDLLRGMQRRLRDRMSGLLRSRSGRNVWGIDIGSGALKAVRVTWDETDKRPRIDAVALVEYAKPLAYAANDAEEAKLVADAVRTFLDGHRLAGDRLCVGLPGRLALGRQFDLPQAPPAKMKKLVEFEMGLQFNLPVDQLTWDFHAFGRTERSQALLVAAKHHLVDRFLQNLHQAGLRANVVQPDFIALHNFLVFDQLSTEDATNERQSAVAAAFDVGCDVTNLVVSSPDSFWFHSCGVSGRSFTRALVREFNLSVAQAEQLKRAPDSGERIGQVQQTLAPVFDDFLREGRQSLAVYGQAEPERPIQQVFGLGGGFATHGLFRYLRCGR